MIGRLIVCLLVICSAAAVAWQRQKSESADIGANLAENKASDAEARAAAAEKRAHDAEERAAEAEAKASFFEAELSHRSAAAEDPINAEHDFHIVSVDFRGIHADRLGRDAGQFALSVAGDPTEIEHIRVFASRPSGEPLWGDTWDTGVGSSSPLDVFHGGKLIVDAHAKTVMKTRAGTTVLSLSVPASGAMIVPGVTYAIQVSTSDGQTATRLVPIQAAQ